MKFFQSDKRRGWRACDEWCSRMNEKLGCASWEDPETWARHWDTDFSKRMPLGGIHDDDEGSFSSSRREVSRLVVARVDGGNVGEHQAGVIRPPHGARLEL